MDVGREALLVGDALEQVVEVVALVFAECGQQGILVLTGERAEGGEHPAAVGGEVEGMAAAVVPVAATLDETALIEGVEEGDEAAGHHLQTGGEGLLGNARAGAEDPQDTGVGGREADGEQPLGKTCGGMAADLGEQESGIAAGLGGLVGPAGFFHRIIVPYQNRSCRE